MKYELIATATFGLEAVVKMELQDLGYSVVKVEDGKVTFIGDERAIVHTNMWLRTADRVYIKVAEFKAETFEELFQQVRAIGWEDYLTVDAAFPVVGTSVKSTLHSVPSCQSIIKKAIVSRLSDFYVQNHFDETGANYRIRFSILKNHVTLLLDTSGAGLHKRGYRAVDVAAPMKETLAAALVRLSFWKEGVMRRDKDNPDHVARILVDPCCGSGTILIEAAMMARNIAPGLNRKFAAMAWDFIPEELWNEERQAAYNAVDYDSEVIIKGFDINGKAIAAAMANAMEAGVEEDISFSRMDMRKFRADESNGIIITNPPYKYSTEFAEKALELVADGRKVAMFLKLTFMENKKRKPFFQKYPPRTVYVSSGRLTCGFNGQFHVHSAKAIAYAWYVWEKGFNDDPVIRWIN